MCIGIHLFCERGANMKIIGYVIITWNNQNIAIDLYEGNKVFSPDGASGEIDSQLYEETLTAYYKNAENFETAYEYNRRNGLEVPEVAARRDARQVGRNSALVERAKENAQDSYGGKQPRKKKKKSHAGVVLILVLLLAAAAGLFVYLYYPQFFRQIHITIGEQPQPEKTQEPEDLVATEKEVILTALTKDIAMSQMITADDIKGVIVTMEQYEKYASQTYIGAGGRVEYVTMIPWSEHSNLIGKYAASDLKAGNLIYTHNVTTQHIVADKTYVEVQADGETQMFEITENSLPGNTNIKLVAVITNEKGEKVQVLISEMTLQDRSLVNFFNSSGQDILDMLTGEKNKQEEGQEEEKEQTEESESAQNE